MTTIKKTKNCLKKFHADFKKGKFSADDGRVLKAWAREMEELGPEPIRGNPEWRDHRLYGKWEGYRASCFSVQGRIIYRVIDQKNVEICEVECIAPDHDYD